MHVRRRYLCLVSCAIVHGLIAIAMVGGISYGSPGLSPAYGFEHPASTLPTRFPAALGIGHGSACGLANACALVYVAA